MRTLTDSLAALHRPVLSWQAASGDTLELTGPVLANWIHKSTGLLAEMGVGPETALGLVDSCGLHWRALAGALAAWGLGASVLAVRSEAEAPERAWIALAHEDDATGDLTASAEEVLVYAGAPLALSVQVDDGYTDFSSAVRTHPDQAALRDVRMLRCGTEAEQEVLDGLEAESARDSAEVVVTSLPSSAEEWRRVLGGLRAGSLVLRQQPPPHA